MRISDWSSDVCSSDLKRASKDTVHLQNLRTSAASRDEKFEGSFMGKVSQRTYDDIFQSRVYDLYGRRLVETEAETATISTGGVTSTLARTLDRKSVR